MFVGCTQWPKCYYLVTIFPLNKNCINLLLFCNHISILIWQFPLFFCIESCNSENKVLWDIVGTKCYCFETVFPSDYMEGFFMISYA